MLGTWHGLPGKPQGTDTQLHTSFSSVAAWTPAVTLCWGEQLSVPGVEDDLPLIHTPLLSYELYSCKAVAATLLLSFSYTQLQALSSHRHTMHTPDSVRDMHSVVFASFVFLWGSGWRGVLVKIRSLSEKQANCHATKEPSPEKLWSNCSHWLTNFFFFFKSNIWEGLLHCSSKTWLT